MGLSEQIVDALAATLIVADLADAGQREAFSAQVREAARGAGDGGDVVLGILAEEVAGVFARLEVGELAAPAAADALAELLTAAGDACRASAAGPKTLKAAGNPYAADAAVVADFVAGAVEQLDEAEEILSARATGGDVDVHALFRCIHTLKGMSGFLALDELADVSHRAESVLDAIRAEGRAMTGDEVEEGLAFVDTMRALVGRVCVAEPGGTGSAVAATEAGARDADPDSAPPASGAPVPSTSATRRSAEQVRVNAARLENLLDAMGELAVAEAELAVAVKRTGDPDALRCLERLERIARDMQGTATALRMVSLKQTFAKMTRVVRDGIARSGNRAELIVSGEHTEIDRTIAEALGDPLVHLLRNAIDHGIEPAAERVSAGKPETGRVELRAFHRSGSVFIEIEDDGRGIDPEQLARKAIERGIDFDPDHPFSLIFEPGFSTAETITELSGRGVGMDAVAAAVASLRGQLDVASEPGRGTRFTIRLPLTLAIIEGIVLRSASERYIVPTHFVERTVSVAPSEIVSAAGQGRVLVLPDGPVSVASIASVLGGSVDDGQVGVVLADGADRFALLVDEVIGQQSLVIKPLTGPTAEAVGPAGAALMGDGRVALVIDPAGLATAMRRGW